MERVRVTPFGALPHGQLSIVGITIVHLSSLQIVSLTKVMKTCPCAASLHERKIVKVGLENPYTFWRLKTATSEHQYVRVRTGDGPGLGPGLNNVKTRRAGDREVHHSHNGHRSQREMGQPWQDGKAGQAGWTRTTTLEVNETLFTQAGPDSNWTGGGLGQCEGVAPRFTAAAANTVQQATEIGWHHAHMEIRGLGMTGEATQVALLEECRRRPRIAAAAGGKAHTRAEAMASNELY